MSLVDVGAAVLKTATLSRARPVRHPRSHNGRYVKRRIQAQKAYGVVRAPLVWLEVWLSLGVVGLLSRLTQALVCWGTKLEHCVD